jgi:ABC-2 type transport system permease protein
MIVSFTLAGVGPVVIPPERLPEMLVVLGRFNAATYAASAMRQAMLGPVTSRIWIDLTVLTLFAVAGFWGVSKKLDWRVT